MSATPAPAATARRWPWLGEFLAGEARAWVYVGKCVLAIFLTGWLAMWLQLEKPSTAMLTVIVVMHPQSGMVLAKSFYRVLGTLTGSLFGLALMSAFPQQRELFLFLLALWVALCAGGATLYRNFMAYSFVLAGYTAVIVVLPAISDPRQIFDSAVMRVSEVLLGIGVTAVVSDLILPQRLRVLLRRSAQSQFAHFIDLVREATRGVLPRERLEEAHLDIMRAAIQLENLRASVIFEDPEVLARSARMRLLNQRYMAAATTLQSLHHLVNRLKRRGRDAVVTALVELYRPIGEALDVPQRHEPAVLEERLRACLAAFPAHLAPLRERCDEPAARLEFDTGAALVERLLEELIGYTGAEAALRSGQPLRGSVERVRFRRGNDLVGAAVAVTRTFLTMTALSLFWLASAWPSGANTMLMATVFSGLLATSPNPVLSASRTLYGYAIGFLAGLVMEFYLLPSSEGYGMLVLACAGLMMIGPYLQTRPALAGMGSGYSLGVIGLTSISNPMVYDAVQFFNTGLSQLGGVGLSLVSFMTIPGIAGSRWQQRRVLRLLRREVERAARAPLDGLAWSFESAARDLLQQVVSGTRPGSELLAWALSVQETGRTLIELRQDLAETALGAPARLAIDRALTAVAQLYEAPDTTRWLEADAAVLAAIRAAPAGAAVRLHLYQLRSALRDEESPLAPYQPRPAAGGSPHAP
ncbi:MAG: FUSC family protein [Fulvimonas sp.]|nr:FUSC family protein [Fulvimonas sp.]